MKADNRAEQLLPGGRAFSTECNDKIVINDIFLAAGAVITVTLSPQCLNIIFPVVGAVNLADGDVERTISHEEIYCSCTAGSNAVTIQSPFIDEPLNFLHIFLHYVVHPVACLSATVCQLNLNVKNSLVRASGIAGCIRVGVYDSRVKGHAHLSENNGSALTYIINGDFEVEDRLMEYRDGLYQWQTGEIAFEALSETSIILLIDCSQF